MKCSVSLNQKKKTYTDKMVDYNKMTVVALKALLKKRGLDDGGWKSALVFRLEKDDGM